MAKIAIVEDDVTIAKMYQLIFEYQGHQVGLAGNGKLGLKLCQEMKPDVVLLDLMMPEMSGEEVLEKLRQQEGGQTPKVFILTNLNQQEAPESLNKLNVSGYIVKAEATPDEVANIINIELSAQNQPPKAT
jgi:DNA-binding response OmpR family regulator